MLGYVATYLGGIATGVGLLLLHQRSVRRAVQIEQARAKREADKLRAENLQMREDLAAFELSSEAARAREQGKIVGLREARNQSGYQRLEQSLNPGGRRTVKVGNPYGFPSSPDGEPSRKVANPLGSQVAYGDRLGQIKDLSETPPNQRFERDASMGGAK